MKILFLSAANSVHTVRWVNALAERGQEVILVSKIDHHEERENSISSNVKVVYLPVKGMRGYYLNAVVLKMFYKKERFDVINVHYASGYGTLARIARLPHILLSVWGSDVYDFPYESRIKEYILKKNLQYADVIASTSINMEEQTKKFLDHEKKIVITPFGVDTQKFIPLQKRKNSKRIVFGIIKALTKKYGITTVVDAFAKFLASLPTELKETAVLQIYGKGEQLQELKEKIRRKKLENCVHLKGFISNDKVPDALHKMDIFVLGSEKESFGVSAVEAMACGLPVVATKVSGFCEVLEDNETGFLVPVGDIDAMAEKMMKLYCDKELREEMGEKGRHRVERMYNWRRNVENMEELYRFMAKNDTKYDYIE